MRVGLRLGLLLPAKLLSTSAKLIAGTPSARWSVAFDCPNWPYRMGSNPFHKRGLSDEQRAAMAERARTNLRRPRAALNDSNLPSAMKRGADRRRAVVIRVHVATDPPTLADLVDASRSESRERRPSSRIARRTAFGSVAIRDLTSN